MERNHKFIPTAFDRLEDRLVMSHYRGYSVVVSGLHPHQNVLNRHQMTVVAEVNQAFASFQADYDQARATYFASITNQSSSPSSGSAAISQATTAFGQYMTQRVSLLAQQLISSFLQYKSATARQHGNQPTLEVLINHRIIGINGGATAGSLAMGLQDSITQLGKSAPVSPSTATLFSLTQDEAIAAAQVAILNGAGILRNGDFGNTPGTYQTQYSH
jgi:hypothetical protein